MKFVAVDVETANPDFSSICQVGVASFQDGQLCESWESLVNPEDYFDNVNISIHGIDEWAVRSSPKWGALHEKLAPWLEGQIVVSHTSFDRVALLRTCEKNLVKPFECRWLDTAQIVRRAWPTFAQGGYGLANIAAHLGIEFAHHNAREDARAAGEVLLRAIAETGLNVEQWLERVAQPVSPSTSQSITRKANPDGLLYGEILVFTGKLSMPRWKAADAASVAGCEVAASVTTQTTLLVIGDQDIRRLAGQEKSSKYREAEERITNGQPIRIISESDFQRLLAFGA